MFCSFLLSKGKTSEIIKTKKLYYARENICLTGKYYCEIIITLKRTIYGFCLDFLFLFLYLFRFYFCGVCLVKKEIYVYVLCIAQSLID